MRIALFYHSLVSDWNHGNAHFLRGVAAELQARGHDVCIYEPAEGWSRTNLLREYGESALSRFAAAFPTLRSEPYHLPEFDFEQHLDNCDLVLVHEWNEPKLVRALGEYRRRNPRMRLLFHDTHHRAVTAPEELAQFDLHFYDGVLAYGASLKHAYERLGWGRQVRVWHEAADTRVFYPRQAEEKEGDLIWVGNWGDDERTEELREFLLRPTAAEGLSAQIYGVRYPEDGLRELRSYGISFGGWLPNFEVPRALGQYRVTVHVPRRPYVRQLPGIPTIRVFEALACGIPLISAPWNDQEQLFRPGTDFLQAEDGNQMRAHLRAIMHDRELSESLARSGLETIRRRHTCAHRVNELLDYFTAIKPANAEEASFYSISATEQPQETFS